MDEPELASVRAALRQVLTGHEPYPAVVVNRWWEMLDSNRGAMMLTEGCAAWLLEPPVNVLRLSLHPDGLVPRIVNLGEWRAHLLTQLRHRARALGDDRLMDLHRELAGYSGAMDRAATSAPHAAGVVLPLRYRRGGQELSFFSVNASVSTATDVTVEELSIEAFYPSDAATAAALQARAQADHDVPE
jgi:hypothetical protein